MTDSNSDNNSESSINLEDAIKEIETLRSQLSGSDLEVFSQNRELRGENQKLRDEVRKLTEQCVTQTFASRGHEKAKVKLEAEVAKLTDEVQKLNSEVESLTGKVELHQSQELQLSTDLEAAIAESQQAIAAKEDEIEKIAAEHSQEFEAARKELESAKVELEETLKKQLADQEAEHAKLLAENEAVLKAKEEEISNLQQRVETFKEEFLSQEYTAVAVETGDEAPASGSAFKLLTEKMEGLLGFPGATMVEQVFRLSDIDQSSTDPAQLEEAFEALQDTASQLVSDAEQEKELATLLSDAWSELGLGEGSAPPSQELSKPVEDEAVVEEEPVEAEPEASQEESQEAEPEAVADETPEVEPEPEVEVEDDAEETLSELSVEEVENEPPSEETTASEKEAPEPAASTEEAPEEEAPATEEVDEESAAESSEPEAEASAEPESEVSSSEQAGSASFDDAAVHLQEGRYSDALPIFEALAAEDQGAEVQVGLLASLAGTDQHRAAYELGLKLEGQDLGDSHDVFEESFRTALLGTLESSGDDFEKKSILVRLLKIGASDEDMISYLDAVDELNLRTSDDGFLNLLQAERRVGQDDVTEYLIDAMQTVSDKRELFSLLKTNLEHYPELRPLADFLECLLDSSRAESLESETVVEELLSQGESIEDLLDESDPIEEAIVQAFLEHLLPRSGVAMDLPSEHFDDYLSDSEPAAFVGAIRQTLRSVDFELFFEKIDVQSYEGDDHFLLRSCPEPTPTVLFGAEIDDVPPEELRFLVLREFFSMYRRHSHLFHLSVELDDEKRCTFLSACIDVHSEADFEVSEDLVKRLEELKESAKPEGQDEAFKASMVAFLDDLYKTTLSDSFLELGDFLFDQQLNRKLLDPIADAFAAKQTGLVVASFAIARDTLPEEEFEKLEESGFNWLYEEENLDKYRELRLRLQRLWTMPLKALITEPEE